MSVVIDLEALLDFRCLQFCVSRTTEYLENSQIATLVGKPLFSEQTRHSIRLKSLLPSVHPRLHAYSLLTALRRAQRSVKIFSFVEESVVSALLPKYSWLPSPSAYVSAEDCIPTLQRLATTEGLVLVHLPQVAVKLQESHVPSVCVPVSPHQGLPLPNLLRVVPGLEAPKLDEYSQWKGHVELPSPVRLSGIVVHGFGKGSSELGFPTANIVPEQSRLQLVPGVYCGKAWLEGQEQSYKAAVSIGWGPHYGNREKSTEIHILHKFNQPLYGQHLTVQLEVYIRAEAEFAGLDDLIQAIAYDVRLTEELID